MSTSCGIPFTINSEFLTAQINKREELLGWFWQPLLNRKGAKRHEELRRESSRHHVAMKCVRRNPQPDRYGTIPTEIPDQFSGCITHTASFGLNFSDCQ